MQPVSLASAILYRDSSLIVLNKPAGVKLHAGPAGGPALEDGFGDLSFGTRQTPRAAHRLDHDTSGCLLLGRHDKAIKKLGRLFSAGRIEKVYWAIVLHCPKEQEGRIDAPLIKRNSPAGWHMAVDSAGQKAETLYRVLASKAGLSWLEFRPRTGRTHQIRVHAAQLGSPLLGDTRYGGAQGDHNIPAGDGGGLLLHARSLTIPYREAAPPIQVEAPLPPRFRDMLKRIAAPELLPNS
ncbi:RluA family pseudouridine synthase [Ferrovibrio sp.]|uniref:RluA family pseudouridine synthase n=1 Tax=Ferrovibrio sp. TaxID=1917215 RepID=UPI0035AF830F